MRCLARTPGVRADAGRQQAWWCWHRGCGPSRRPWPMTPPRCARWPTPPERRSPSASSPRWRACRFCAPSAAPKPRRCASTYCDNRPRRSRPCSPPQARLPKRSACAGCWTSCSARAIPKKPMRAWPIPHRAAPPACAWPPASASCLPRCTSACGPAALVAAPMSAWWVARFCRSARWHAPITSVSLSSNRRTHGTRWCWPGSPASRASLHCRELWPLRSRRPAPRTLACRSSPGSNWLGCAFSRAAPARPSRPRVRRCAWPRRSCSAPATTSRSRRSSRRCATPRKAAAC